MKVTYYSFTNAQKKELPVEFCFFEKVLSDQVKTQRKNKAGTPKKSAEPFYKPIIPY
jgi:hypothetical protein